MSRFLDTLYLISAGNTSATSVLTVDNGTASNIFLIRDDGKICFNTGSPDSNYMITSAGGAFFEGACAIGFTSAGSTYSLYVNIDSAHYQGYFQVDGTASAEKIAVVGAVNTTNSNNNIAGYFTAVNGANNYAIIVPSASGNVGIGTSAPSVTNKLEVVGSDTTSSNNAAVFSSSTSSIFTVRDDHKLIFDGISSGYASSQRVEAQAGVQTTDATATSIATIVVNSNEMIIVKGYVSGFRSTFAESYGAHFFAVFYNNGGSLVQVDTTDIIEKYNFSGTPTIDVLVAGSPAVVEIQVIGEAAKTVNWTCTYEYQKTLTSA